MTLRVCEVVLLSGLVLDPLKFQILRRFDPGLILGVADADVQLLHVRGQDPELVVYERDLVLRPLAGLRVGVQELEEVVLLFCR